MREYKWKEIWRRLISFFTAMAIVISSLFWGEGSMGIVTVTAAASTVDDIEPIVIKTGNVYYGYEKEGYQYYGGNSYEEVANTYFIETGKCYEAGYPNAVTEDSELLQTLPNGFTYNDYVMVNGVKVYRYGVSHINDKGYNEFGYCVSLDELQLECGTSYLYTDNWVIMFSVDSLNLETTSGVHHGYICGKLKPTVITDQNGKQWCILKFKLDVWNSDYYGSIRPSIANILLPFQHKVTYHHNYGSGDTKTVIGYKSGLTDLWKGPQREGYELIGWSFNSTTSSSMKAYSIAYNIDLYAVWSEFEASYCDASGQKKTSNRTVTPVDYENWATWGWINIDKRSDFIELLAHYFPNGGSIYSYKKTTFEHNKSYLAVYYKHSTAKFSLGEEYAGNDSAPSNISKSCWKLADSDNIYIGNKVENSSYILLEGTDKIKLPEKPKWENYVFCGWADEEGNVYEADTEISLKNGQTTFTAQWKPDQADYKIRHYKMKVGGSGYELDKTETFTKTTDTVIRAVDYKKTYTGFSYQNAKIGNDIVTEATVLADGSRVIDLYYSRNQYAFTLNGIDKCNIDGSTVTGDYYYGQLITLKAVQNIGYTWKGWKSSDSSLQGDISEKNSSFTMPAGAVTMTPQVTVNKDTAYKIRHYQENVGGNGYTLAEIENKTGTTDTLLTAALYQKVYTGFQYKEAKKENEIVTTVNLDGNGNLEIDLYYAREKYSFSLKDCKGCNTSGSTVSGNYYYGETVTLKAVPKAGYTWKGWKSSDSSLQGDISEKNGSFTMPAGAVAMEPQVMANTDTPYKIIIHRENLKGNYLGTDTDIIVKKTGITDEEVKASSIAAKYNYEGFRYDYAIVNGSSQTAERKSAAAIMNIDGDGTAELHLYYARNKYQLKIGTYDASTVSTENTDTELLYGQSVTLRAHAAKGCNFTRWDSSNTVVQSDLLAANTTFSMPAANLTMTPYASSINYTVVFHANDTDCYTPENNVRAAGVPKAQQYAYTESVTMPMITRTGFTLKGWARSRSAKEAEWKPGEAPTALSSTDQDTIILYAVWSENSYTVHFLPNNEGTSKGNAVVSNVEGSIASLKVYYTQTVTFPRTGFSRKGFTLRGWSETAGNSPVVYAKGEETAWLCAEDGGVYNVYASWREHFCTVYFSANDIYCYGANQGVNETVSNPDVIEPVKVYYTQGFTFPDKCDYIRKGFTCIGWSQSKADSIETENVGYTAPYSMNQTITFTEVKDGGSVTFYPVWREHIYTIVYHANDTVVTPAVNSMSSQTIYYTQLSYLKKNNFSRRGFIFRGWSVTADDRTVDYQNSNNIQKETEEDRAVLDLYAVWQEISYIVQFEPNDNYCYASDEGIKVAVSNPNAAQELTLSYTQEGELPQNPYKRNGFTFVGWSRKKSDTLRVYEEEDFIGSQPGTKLSFLTDENGSKITYYAVWRENKYSVIFDKNDSKNAFVFENETHAKGTVQTLEHLYYTQKATLPDNQFTRTGFTWKGWSEKRSSNLAAYRNKEEIRSLSKEDNGIVTLYAAWKEHKYTVHFLPADSICYEQQSRIPAKGEMKDVVLKYTENFTVATEYRRKGFTFLGYSQTDDNALTYQDGYSVPYKENSNICNLVEEEDGKISLYMIWQENQYPIVFHPNDGSQKWDIETEAGVKSNVWAQGSMKNMLLYYSESAYLPANAFTRQGYLFEGWSSVPGGKVEYKDGQKVSRERNQANDSLDLYAVWKILPPTGEDGKIIVAVIGSIINTPISGGAVSDGTVSGGGISSGTVSGGGISQGEAIVSYSGIKPGSILNLSVAVSGAALQYQWYYIDGTAAVAIEGAVYASYTVASDKTKEENHGDEYFCIISNKAGSVESAHFILNIYGTPELVSILKPESISTSEWYRENIFLQVTGGAIRGSVLQTEYVYSVDDMNTWEIYPAQGIYWEENTEYTGQTIYIKAYNRECQELESKPAKLLIKKDSISPEKITVDVDTEISTGTSITGMNIIVSAEDRHSGIQQYGVTKKYGGKNIQWNETGIFKLTDRGVYCIYVTDYAGNISLFEMIVLPNGEILQNTSDGSYLDIDEEKLYIFGDSVTLPETAKEKKGYEFIGWETKDGTRYEPGETIYNLNERDGELILYPVYKRIEIPVIKPTEPAVIPTQPAVTPTEPAVIPTEPAVTPTEPAIIPTEPAVTPTEPVIIPTEPAITPTEPVIIPTQPAVTPTEPAIIPTQPAVMSTESGIDTDKNDSNGDKPSDNPSEEKPNGGISSENNSSGNKPPENESNSNNSSGSNSNSNSSSQGGNDFGNTGVYMPSGSSEQISGQIPTQNIIDDNKKKEEESTEDLKGIVTSGGIINGAEEEQSEGQQSVNSSESNKNNLDFLKVEESHSKKGNGYDDRSSNTSISNKKSNSGNSGNVGVFAVKNLKKIKIIQSFSVISLYRAERYKIKIPKGIKNFHIKNKKIISIKKKGKYLILAGKKKGNTVLTGKKNGQLYEITVQVKRPNVKTVYQLVVEGKKKSIWKFHLSKNKIYLTRVSILEQKSGKAIFRLSHVNKKIKWIVKNGSFEKLRKNRIAVKSVKGKSCVVTAKYKGNEYCAIIKLHKIKGQGEISQHKTYH